MADQNKTGVLKFPVSSFRKIPNPYLLSKNDGQKRPEMYVLVVDVKDVPEDIPMQTNPREQKFTTDVAKKIKSSLTNHTDLNFYLLNRGLLLSADTVNFDNVTNEVSISFTDLNVHGDVDGGHTYRIIKENRSLLERGEQYVKIEVLTGIEDFFEDLAEARNTSVQVHDKSMEELRNHFEMVKMVLASQPYFNDISFKENDQKRIDITDILAIMTMFNAERYPVKSLSAFPTVSYSSKATCVDYYIKSYHQHEADQTQNPYFKICGILPTIIELFDKLETKIGDYYRESGQKAYGKVTGVASHKSGTPDFHSKFFYRVMDYQSPNGFLYPIIGAFRALLKEEDGKYVWIKDPLKILDDLGADLVASTIDMSRSLRNNPQSVGKNTALWKNLFMSVRLAVMSGD